MPYDENLLSLYAKIEYNKKSFEQLTKVYETSLDLDQQREGALHGRYYPSRRLCQFWWSPWLESGSFCI